MRALFVSFKILGYSILAGYSAKEALCGTNGYSNPPCPHSAYRKTSVHNLVSPIGGKTISNKSSIIILRLSEERIYT